MPLALAAADPADRRLAAYLTMMEHLPGLLIGRVDGVEELCAESLANGDDLNTKWFAGAMAYFAAMIGDLRTARRHLDILDDVLGRWGLVSTPGTAGFGFVGALEVAMLEGRLAEARALASNADLSPTEHSLGAAMATVRLGCMLGDDDLVEEAARWVDRHDPPGRMRATPPAVHSELALRVGDTSAAAVSAVECWGLMGQNGVIRALHAELAVVALLSDGRVTDARRVLADIDADAERESARQVALAHHGAALLALHEGRDRHATEAAHSLLDVAHRSGFVPMAIDALLMLAEIADRRSREVTAARLAGAANAARARIGYRVPLLTHLIDVDGLAERLASEEPAAFDDGSRLDVDGAVELVRRMRGERNRPDVGWASLTPTEGQVAELASAGATNAQIGQRLLMKPATVKTHLTHIFTKLGVANRTELAHLSSRADPGESQNQEESRT